jgi:hypothetical protein
MVNVPRQMHFDAPREIDQARVLCDDAELEATRVGSGRKLIQPRGNYYRRGSRLERRERSDLTAQDLLDALDPLLQLHRHG